MLSTHAIVPARTLEQLLSYNDERFIVSAYHTLLARAPDTEGMRYYLMRLRADVSKIEILAQLRSSPEGKSREIQIPGLKEAVRRHKQLKTPLLGPLLRIAGVKQVTSDKLKKRDTHVDSNSQNLVELLNQHGLTEQDIPDALSLEKINQLNPHDHFGNIFQALKVLIKQIPARKLRIFDNDELNANFYVKLGLHNEQLGDNTQATELYRLSLLFFRTAKAHEHLGNLALTSGKNYQAIEHYQNALKLNNKSYWVYANLSHAHDQVGNYEDAVKIICAGLVKFPASALLVSRLDDAIDSYWNVEEQKLECIAELQYREILISEYERVTSFISDQYANFFKRTSEKSIRTKLNDKRVLIVGLPKEILPQCYRYRIEQKIEQLQYAGYESETVAWYDYENATNLINFYDLVIFYRVPAFPKILKMVEYAKALGKITFYEVDDLLFESFSVPSLESYGGQLSLSAYTNVTKDIGSCRAVARKCEYAIASTQPLIERLGPLTLRGICYLHRNGLDKYNSSSKAPIAKKEYVNLFYGSGTLAHNSDFILEAVPAISRILRENKNVKLTVVGSLTLPEKFLYEFKEKIVLVPLVKEITAYWTYLAASDINLAVLHDDILNGCKSELKWFEAATFSIPSIVSRTRNYLDIIKHERDGFIVSGENQWYETLNQLIQNSELRLAVGNRAYERVKVEYSVANLASNIHRIMTSAISDYSKHN